ncbi:MAG: helix-turn-helix domain-containing protein [Chloroflexota bacterium]|nr:helix-turn-helix domain-containing protein [Chloroflexota bacterium]
MSRFARAGLPSPKNYLSAIRLLHAAYLFESAGLSVADVAYRLEYSSPQSFGRHLRAMLGVTALEYRRRYPFPVALERFIELMVEPYHDVWRDFHPVAGVQLGERLLAPPPRPAPHATGPVARTSATPA